MLYTPKSAMSGSRHPRVGTQALCVPMNYSNLTKSTALEPLLDPLWGIKSIVSIIKYAGGMDTTVAELDKFGYYKRKTKCQQTQHTD